MDNSYEERTSLLQKRAGSLLNEAKAIKMSMTATEDTAVQVTWVHTMTLWNRTFWVLSFQAFLSEQHTKFPVVPEWHQDFAALKSRSGVGRGY